MTKGLHRTLTIFFPFFSLFYVLQNFCKCFECVKNSIKRRQSAHYKENILCLPDFLLLLNRKKYLICIFLSEKYDRRLTKEVQGYQSKVGRFQHKKYEALSQIICEDSSQVYHCHIDMGHTAQNDYNILRSRLYCGGSSNNNLIDI